MAVLMWQQGEVAVPKALMAVKLYKSLAQEATMDDLEVEVSEVLQKSAKDFEIRGKNI
jgi:transient receptor potential cation channel subfamily M protein 3